MVGEKRSSDMLVGTPQLSGAWSKLSHFAEVVMGKMDAHGIDSISQTQSLDAHEPLDPDEAFIR